MKKIWQEYKSLFFVYISVLFLIYLTYLWITFDIENSKFEKIKDKNYFPQVEIKTK